MSTETPATKPEKPNGITLTSEFRAMSLMPSSFADVMELSKYLANSALVPSTVRTKPADVAILIATGLEYGLAPMVSLRQIYVVEGKPALSAAAQMAVVLRRPDVCEYFRLIESTPERSTYETKRKGWSEPTRLTYSIKDAEKAGLTSKPNWKLNPLKMLNNRCKSTLLDAVYSDLLLGMQSDEELVDEVGFEHARDITPPTAAQANEGAGARVMEALKRHVDENPLPPQEEKPKKAKPAVVEVPLAETPKSATATAPAPATDPMEAERRADDFDEEQWISDAIGDAEDEEELLSAKAKLDAASARMSLGARNNLAGQLIKAAKRLGVTL